MIKNARKSTKGRIGIPSESSGVGITSNLNRVTRHTDASTRQSRPQSGKPSQGTRNRLGQFACSSGASNAFFNIEMGGSSKGNTQTDSTAFMRAATPVLTRDSTVQGKQTVCVNTLVGYRKRDLHSTFAKQNSKSRAVLKDSRPIESRLQSAAGQNSLVTTGQPSH